MRSGLHLFHAPRRRCLPSASVSLLRPILSSPMQIPNTKPPTHGTKSRDVRLFSATPQRCAGRKKPQAKRDMRITLIRYHLQHPLTPRPLRFSRNRALRHWTIHRAWQLYRAKLRDAQEKELERQFNSIRSACEALRLTGEDGLSITEPGSSAVPPPGARDLKETTVKIGAEEVNIDVQAAAKRQRDVGKLYRTAMMKTGVWDGVPIEYARSQTETPPRDGWDHNWTR